MVPIHPGRILKRELAARELSANKLALALRVPSGRITGILNGKRAITPETALRLGRYFGNSAQFWLNLQARYDLLIVDRELGERIKAEVEQAAYQVTPSSRREVRSSLPWQDRVRASFLFLPLGETDAEDRGLIQGFPNDLDSASKGGGRDDMV